MQAKLERRQNVPTSSKGGEGKQWEKGAEAHDWVGWRCERQGSSLQPFLYLDCNELYSRKIQIPNLKTHDEN